MRFHFLTEILYSKVCLTKHRANFRDSSRLVYKSKFPSYLLMPLLILSFFTSCNDNSADSGNLFENIVTGSFTAEITGDINQKVSGVAVFGTQIIDGPTGNIFVLTLSTINTDINYLIGVTYLSSSRPGTGTRSIENEGEQSEGYFVVNPANEDIDYYNSQSGELTITSSDSESLQGNLSLNAVLPQNGNEVTINATFNASCQSSQFTTCD